MKMSMETYASFEVLVELDKGDPDEAEKILLNWIEENAEKLTGTNIEVIQLSGPAGVEGRVLKTGDKVTASLDGERKPGTVISFSPQADNGPDALVRFENGALRTQDLDDLALRG